MNRLPVLLLLPLVLLAGCQTTPEREPLGTEVPAPVGEDGLTVEDRIALDEQRQRQALEIANQLAVAPERSITPALNPLKRPTVAVKYAGKPPEGLLNAEEKLAAYRASYMDGETVVYATDLAQMTMIMERMKEGEPYDYREITTTVPYGYCLDFIDENLGKMSEKPKGYRLIKVECSQDKLGMDF